MKSQLAIIGSICAMLAVVLGAFGAHGLKPHLDTYQLSIFETGIRYQFYHSIAIFIAYFSFQQKQLAVFQYAGWCFFVGVLLFSGSLYLLACRHLMGLDGWTFILGPATPLGGVFFIIAWLLLLLGFTKKSNQD